MPMQVHRPVHHLATAPHGAYQAKLCRFIGQYTDAEDDPAAGSTAGSHLLGEDRLISLVFEKRKEEVRHPNRSASTPRRISGPTVQIAAPRNSRRCNQIDAHKRRNLLQPWLLRSRKNFLCELADVRSRTKPFAKPL